MYSDYLSINTIFQSSINLEYDLGNEAKIKQYIPTGEGCSILRQYIATMIPEFRKAGDNRATVLLGPYGKGKSFLLLILLYLISSDPSSSCYTKLVGKIGEVDPELGDMIVQLISRKIKLLPILVNSNYSDLNKAFRIGLSDSLTRNNLGSSVVSSSYTVAADILKKWLEDDFLEESQILEICGKQNCLKQLLNDLEREEITALNKFSKIYENVTGGLAFDPLVREDIPNSLKKLADTLFLHKYSGVFIVFDEFSKFLESGVSNLMEQLSILQNVFEISSRSGDNNQIHICCVTHKELNYYNDLSDTAKVSAFRAVEGRIKEIRFSSSLDENFSLVAQSIKKTSRFSGFYSKIKTLYSNIYDLYKRISKLQDEAFLEDVVFKGCFPLNPFTVIALINLSERFAQNERTLFTFIADSDKGSLRSFLFQNDTGLIGVDSLYDYFFSVLVKDEDSNIRNICYRAEACLNNASNDVENALIKTIAIASVIDNSAVLPRTREFLLAACNLDFKKYSALFDLLEEQSKISTSILSGNVSFTSGISKEIDEAIEKHLLGHGSSFDLGFTITELSNQKFVIPRKYNIDNKIVRYYKVVFVDETVLLNLKTLSFLFDKHKEDGILINVVRTTDTIYSFEKIKDSIISKIDDPRIVVKYPNKLITAPVLRKIKEYWALSSLLNNDKFSNEKAELSVIYSELKDDLSQKIDLIYRNDFEYLPNRGSSFQEEINEIFAKAYCNAPIVNNEMLNKHTLTSQYAKARNNIIETLLTGGNFDSYSETGPEMTVYNSVFDAVDSENICKAIAEIKRIIMSSKNNCSFSELVYPMLEMPYGIREGVLPLLIAKAVSELPGEFTVFFKSHFVVMTSNILASAIINPKEYFFLLDQDVATKIDLLEKLMDIFAVQKCDNFFQNLLSVSDAIRRYCSSMPLVVRTATEKDPLGLSSKAIRFNKIFLKYDVNAYEAVFGQLTHALELRDHSDVNFINDEIQAIKKEIDTAYPRILDSVIVKVKNVLGGTEKDSIHALVEEWSIKNNLKNKRFKLKRVSEKALADILIRSEVSFDDRHVVNLIAKVITGTMVCDWSNDKTMFVCNGLSNFMKDVTEDSLSISESLKITKAESLSPLALSLKNYVSSVISEFGDSIAPDEVSQVLLQILKEVT